MDNSSDVKCEIPYQPSYYQDYGDDVQQISHNLNFNGDKIRVNVIKINYNLAMPVMGISNYNQFS